VQSPVADITIFESVTVSVHETITTRRYASAQANTTMVCQGARITIVTFDKIQVFVHATRGADTEIIGAGVAIVASRVVNTEHNINLLLMQSVQVTTAIVGLFGVLRQVEQIRRHK
jgi:hypothetical protein